MSTFVLWTSVSLCAGRLCASSNANRTHRSAPIRVLTDPCVATSYGVPLRRNPPSPAYVPSVFSRMTTKSAPCAIDPGTPVNGRRLM